MNAIELAKIYTSNLAKKWVLTALTAILEDPKKVKDVKDAPADTIFVKDIALTGLKDYSRANGFEKGNVNIGFIPLKMEMDRGSQFNLDAMDSLESMKTDMGQILSVFQDEEVVPEVDAYRFSKIAKGSLPAYRAYGTLNTGDAVLSAISAGEVALKNAKVPTLGRVLFITPEALSLLKDKVGANRFIANNDKRINRDIEVFDNMQVIEVPSAEFHVGWQKDPDGGFIAEGSAINFMIVHKDAVLPVIKHHPVRIFDASQNQNADAHLLDYRIYHDLFVTPKKENGIYLHTVEAYTPETVDKPVITVEDNNTASVKFTASSPTAGASLYYTLDGTTPTSASSAYSSKVTVTDDTIPATETSEKTIKVIAIKAGMLDSEVTSKKIKVVGSKVVSG